MRYTERLEIKERSLRFVDCSERADATGIYGHVKHCHVLSRKWSSAETASGPSICDVHALYGPQVEFGFGGYQQGKLHINYVFFKSSAFFSQPGTHHAYQQHQKELGVKAELMSIIVTQMGMSLEKHSSCKKFKKCAALHSFWTLCSALS